MQQVIAPGTVIDRRYQIQKKIKGSTTNTCYLAEDTHQSNRLVTLSFPRIELLILPGFANAFKDACGNLASSRIHGLVKVLDSGLYESQPYAVLQNVADESLESQFQHNIHSKQTVTVDSVLDWATPLAVCLDELHEADYVHSNVRPSSVYVGSKELHLGDFITEFTLQRMGKFKGAIDTLDVSDYLAPEYLKSYYTPNYDQYLLATMIYQALAGKAPFDHADSGDEYRMQVATKIAEPLQSHRAELSAVSDVLAQALDRNPVNRFNSCRALISHIQDAQLSAPKVVALKPALKDTPEAPVEEWLTNVDPAFTSIRNEDTAAKSKKGLMWLGVILLGSAAVAFTVINQNGADQITSNPDKVKSASGAATVVPVKTVDSSNVNSALITHDADEKTEQVAAETGSSSILVDGEEDPTPEQLTVVSGTQLRSLIEQEVSLAQQETEVVTPENNAIDTKENVLEAISPEQFSGDFSELTAAISQAVNDGQKEFIQNQHTETVAEPEPESTATFVSVDVAAINNEVSSAAVADEGTDTELDGQPPEKEKINQEELLAAQTLVSEGEVGIAQEETGAGQTIQHRPDNNVQEVSDSEASSQQPIDSPVNIPVTDTTSAVAEDDNALVQEQEANVIGQPVLTERERIRAFKEKELARIKAVTDDCVGGGKVHREAAAGDLTFVKGCMAVGVDPNITQSDGWTLLHIAARSGHLNMSKLLVAKGVQINAKSVDGLTAMDMAISQKKTRVVNYLKERGGLTTR